MREMNTRTHTNESVCMWYNAIIRLCPFCVAERREFNLADGNDIRLMLACVEYSCIDVRLWRRNQKIGSCR